IASARDNSDWDVWVSKVDLRLQCGMPCSKLEVSTVQHGTLSGTGYLHQSRLGKPGTAKLLVDGAQVAEGRIERTIPFRISADETLGIGEDTGTPVSEDYHVPFRFTGDLKKLAIQLTDAPLTAEEQGEIERMRANIALSE